MKFPQNLLSNDIDDSCTDISDGSSDDVFIVPQKLSAANLSCTSSNESCPGFVMFNNDIDDSRTAMSEGSCDGLFIVPLKTMVPQAETDASLLSTGPSCMAFHEPRLGLASLPPRGLTPTEPSESPASEEWGFISRDCHDEEIEGKVRDWPGCSDRMLGGVIEPWPPTGEDGDGEVAKL